MDDGSASVFCFTPLRVPVSELGRLAICPPAQPSSTAPVCSASPLPEGPCPVCPRLEQEFEAFRLAGYWKAMHARALDREAQLKAEVERLEALLRLREQQLFGRKTETVAATVPSAPDAPRGDTAARRPRGQQRGRPGPKRRDYSLSRRSSRIMTFRPTSASARAVASPSPPFPAPRTPPSWRSRSGPIAGSSAADAIGPPAPVALIPASSRPRRRLG